MAPHGLERVDDWVGEAIERAIRSHHRRRALVRAEFRLLSERSASSAS
jgi:hypothetical protein